VFEMREETMPLAGVPAAKAAGVFGVAEMSA
jgi:hypothetical protein